MRARKVIIALYFKYPGDAGHFQRTNTSVLLVLPSSYTYLKNLSGQMTGTGVVVVTGPSSSISDCDEGRNEDEKRRRRTGTIGSLPMLQRYLVSSFLDERQLYYVVHM